MSTELVPVVERGRQLFIKTPEDYAAAGEFLKGATQLYRSVQLEFRGTKDQPGPIAQASRLHTALCDQEKARLTPITEVIERVKGLMLGWDNTQKQIAANAQAEADRAAASVAPGLVVPMQQVVTTASAVGISDRRTWKAEITDYKAFFTWAVAQAEPLLYISPEMAMLDSIAKRQKDGMNIPGVTARCETNKSVRL